MTARERIGRQLVGGGASDLDRLRLLESSTDGFTRSNVAALGLPSNAACLELGAGAGAVAAWLGSTFSEGSVLAVDIDISGLESARGAFPENVTVERHDITSPSFQPGDDAFDLIHCRYVLSHFSERNEIVRRAVRWLRSGGWLMLTEPYHLDPGTAPHPAVARVLDAYLDLAVAGGADLRWSRSMPLRMAEAGLRDVEFTARAGLLGGGVRDRWYPLLAPVADAMIERGNVTRADLDAVFTLLERDDFLDIPQIIIAAWGQRP